ncbi:MAG: LytTR family DNA-binding domain-containing protein [Oscillospiraceae bacterium]|nr:LytTR family DNA-binding domain-containing protein [Oscillospiraceae bacterium]
MKLQLIEDGALPETEITIRCRAADEDILKMAAMLRAFDHKLTGICQGETWILDENDILYADTADRHTFLYTGRGVYETPLRLYELEERLSPDFFRSGKSSLLNFSHIRSIRPDLGGRLLVTLSNGERQTVSRQYAREVRRRLGLT